MTADNREQRRKQRDAILRKIRALLAKNIENGATEAEAIAAAEKAASMMAEYDLTMDDLDVSGSGIRREDLSLEIDLMPFIGIVAVAISKLTETRFWTDSSRQAGTFYGLPHDVEISVYLFKICKSAMIRASKAHKASVALMRASIRSSKVRSFLTGMASRLAERLDEMAAARYRSTGGALVPLKNAVIDEAMASEEIKLKDRNSRFGDIHLADLIRGRGAGDKVALDPAIRDLRERDQIES